jgi:hypothetical protein
MGVLVAEQEWRWRFRASLRCTVAVLFDDPALGHWATVGCR